MHQSLDMMKGNFDILEVMKLERIQTFHYFTNNNYIQFGVFAKCIACNSTSHIIIFILQFGPRLNERSKNDPSGQNRPDVR